MTSPTKSPGCSQEASVIREESVRGAIPTEEAKQTARLLLQREGVNAGISSGANLRAAMLLASRPEFKGKHIVTIACDTGERYLSTDLFPHDDNGAAH